MAESAPSLDGDHDPLSAAALWRTAQRLRQQLEEAEHIAGLGSWSWSLTTGEVTWSKETYRIFGVPPDSLPSFEQVLEFAVDDERRAGFLDRLGQALRGEQPFDFEIPARLPSGAVVTIHTRGAVERDAVGQPIRVVGTAQDVTAIRASEHALLEREARFRTLAESSPTGVFLADVNGGPTYANQRLLDWFAMNFDEFAAGRWFERIHSDDQPIVMASMETTIGTSRAFDEEYRILHDGRPRWIRVRTQPVMCSEGTTVLGHVGSVVDTTAERFAAEERDRLQEQLQQARKLESLGLLAGGVAHDFNNLLVGILGNASLARAIIPLDARGLEVLGDIERAAKRASALTQQLLAYAGHGRVERHEVNISDLVAEMPALLGARVPSSVSLAVAVPAVAPIVDGDETQLRQVILNLITNAVDAVGDGSGRVEISVTCDRLEAESLAQCLLGAKRDPGPYAVVSVRDTGIGMSDAVRERMFDPFYSTKAPGRGLGLAATLGILNGHGGAIRVTSEVDVGTTISVLLPAVGGGTPLRGMPPVDPFERTCTGTILLVDDDAGARTAARRILARAGFTVLEAGNGQDALEQYDAMPEAPVCVVLDLAMPIMGGEECFRELRRRGSAVPVLMISGYDAGNVARSIASRRDAAFLQKPYSASELLHALQTTVASS